MILSDYIRGFLEGDDDVAEGDTPDALTLRIIDILDAAIQVSPYNADLKLRFMHFCSLMNYSNDIIATFNTMDIKSVQL